MRSRAILAFVLFALFGCTRSHTVLWSLAYPAGGMPAGAYLVHTELKTDCAATGVLLAFDDSYDGTVREGMSDPIAPGSYAISVQVRARDCSLVLSGCQPFTVPASTPVVVNLTDARGPGCTGTMMCMGNGYCGPTVLTDLGIDAGPGPMDMATDMPFDATMPPLDMAGGCTGCMLGGTCRGGVTPDACGSGGGACAVCSGAMSACEHASCVGDVAHFALAPRGAVLLKTDHNVYSAGDDTYSQRGVRATATPTFSFEELTPSPAGHAVAIAATQFATCAIDDAGALWCWGTNDIGNLGTGSTTMDVHATPVQVSAGTHWAMIDGGTQHFCGIQTDGTLWCWGYGMDGELGMPGAVQFHPVQVGHDGWIAVSAGDKNTCAVKADGTLWCWGDNSKGQVGNGSTSMSVPVTSPSQVGTQHDWFAVSVEGTHACGLRTFGVSGTLWCWGDPASGALGLGAPGAPVTSPTQVGTDVGWVEVSSGLFHTCAVRIGTGLTLEGWCWGFNSWGALGDGSTTEHDMPELLPAHWARLVADWNATCGVQTDNSLYCWGRNDAGKLGVGLDPATTMTENNPTPVSPSGL